MEDPSNLAAQQMVDFMETYRRDMVSRQDDPSWQKDNLEYDLRTNEYMLEKVRNCRIYSQHLYAALCNNEFTKNEVWPLLQEKTWGVSWRYAGGIIADMRQEGDYIDWYCSGIRGNDTLTEEQYNNLNSQEQQDYLETKAMVSESVVTDEVRQDLLNLGWLIVGDNNEF